MGSSLELVDRQVRVPVFYDHQFNNTAELEIRDTVVLHRIVRRQLS